MLTACGLSASPKNLGGVPCAAYQAHQHQGVLDSKVFAQKTDPFAKGVLNLQVAGSWKRSLFFGERAYAA